MIFVQKKNIKTKSFFSINDKIVGCATFYPEKLEGIDAKRAYRLRGMATDENYRKKGCGKTGDSRRGFSIPFS